MGMAPEVERGFSPSVPFFIDPDSNAARQEARFRAEGDDADADTILAIATQPQADWLVGGGNVAGSVSRRLDEIDAQQALPVFVAYNVPGRDCSGYSTGGANTADEYRRWIDSVATALGDHRAVVILEPDSLALTECLPPDRLAERYDLIRFAVSRLLQQPRVAVYLDGGHSAWHSASDQASRLQRAGIDVAQGFFLNVSNFQTTDAETAYGHTMSDMLGGAHFVIDTSRNGNGPWQSSDPETWCNPPGRALGLSPTVATGDPSIDALLWIKRPGESDGTCRNAPAAGQWWPEYAVELARNRP